MLLSPLLTPEINPDEIKKPPVGGFFISALPIKKERPYLLKPVKNLLKNHHLKAAIAPPGPWLQCIAFCQQTVTIRLASSGYTLPYLQQGNNAKCCSSTCSETTQNSFKLRKGNAFSGKENLGT